MLKAAAITSLTFALLSGPALAGDKVLGFLTPDVVAGALRAAGAQDVAVAQPSPLSDGTHVVTATDADGRALNMVLRACDAAVPTHCLGLYMIYRWSLDGASVGAGSLNRFNSRYAFAKAHVDGDGGLVLDRYVIADGGITASNLAENVAIFMRMPARLLSEIDVTQPPRPDRTPMT